jgi:hypothetical protein
MSFFNEIKAVLTLKEIVFKEMKKENEGVYTFVFEPVKPLEWFAGKHAMFPSFHSVNTRKSAKNQICIMA